MWDEEWICIIVWRIFWQGTGFNSSLAMNQSQAKWIFAKEQTAARSVCCMGIFQPTSAFLCDVRLPWWWSDVIQNVFKLSSSSMYFYYIKFDQEYIICIMKSLFFMVSVSAPTVPLNFMCDSVFRKASRFCTWTIKKNIFCKEKWTCSCPNICTITVTVYV